MDRVGHLPVDLEKIDRNHLPLEPPLDEVQRDLEPAGELWISPGGEPGERHVISKRPARLLDPLADRDKPLRPAPEPLNERIEAFYRGIEVPLIDGLGKDAGQARDAVMGHKNTSVLVVFTRLLLRPPAPTTRDTRWARAGG